MSTTEGTEPFTVERLRGLMAGASEAIRECPSILWAADEIERLRVRLVNVDTDAALELEAERALADKLAAQVAHFVDGGTWDESTLDTFAKWREARA